MRTARPRCSPSNAGGSTRRRGCCATRRVWLTLKEVGILRHLLRTEGGVIRQELLAEVCGYNSAVTTHTLQTHIYRLRNQIEADPSDARLLLTTRTGYWLDAAAA